MSNGNFYTYKNAYYEGSPELGYASRDQIAEFTEQKELETEADQLFSLRDPTKTAQFGTLIFRRMVAESGMSLALLNNPGEPRPIYDYRGGDDVIGGTRFEVGTVDEELGVLVNLDHFDKLVNGGAWTEYSKVNLRGKTKVIVDAYIEMRKQLSGITISRYTYR